MNQDEFRDAIKVLKLRKGDVLVVDASRIDIGALTRTTFPELESDITIVRVHGTSGKPISDYLDVIRRGEWWE